MAEYSTNYKKQNSPEGVLLGDLTLWSRITKYNLALRADSTKCSRPHLGRFHFLKK